MVGMGLIPAGQPDKNAPLVIISLAGFIFVISGVMILIGNHSRLHSLCAVLICVSFAVVGGWASFTASPENISGGLPYVSDDINVLFARMLFGFGVIISIGLALYAFKELISGNKINEK